MTNGDVILYLIDEKIESEDTNNENDNSNIFNDDHEIGLRRISREEINSNIRRVNQRNEEFLRRGFNIFLATGLTPAELLTLRHLFHLSSYQESIRRGQPFSWEIGDMYEREENWLRAQRNNMFNDINLENRNNQQMRRRNLIIRSSPNRNYYALFARGRNNYRDRRYIGSYSVHESNLSFLCGLLLGLSFNVFAIFLLLCFRFRRKLTAGIFLGLLISICFIDIPRMHAGRERKGH